MSAARYLGDADSRCEACARLRVDLVRCGWCERQLCPEHVRHTMRGEVEHFAVCTPCHLDDVADKDMLYGRNDRVESVFAAMIEALGPTPIEVP